MCNAQLSTFNGVTERANGGLDMGTDTQCEARWEIGLKITV